MKIENSQKMGFEYDYKVWVNIIKFVKFTGQQYLKYESILFDVK